jgi:hypothetical protein
MYARTQPKNKPKNRLAPVNRQTFLWNWIAYHKQHGYDLLVNRVIDQIDATEVQ